MKALEPVLIAIDTKAKWPRCVELLLSLFLLVSDQMCVEGTCLKGPCPKGQVDVFTTPSRSYHCY